MLAYGFDEGICQIQFDRILSVSSVYFNYEMTKSNSRLKICHELIFIMSQLPSYFKSYYSSILNVRFCGIKTDDCTVRDSGKRLAQNDENIHEATHVTLNKYICRIINWEVLFHFYFAIKKKPWDLQHHIVNLMLYINRNSLLISRNGNSVARVVFMKVQVSSIFIEKNLWTSTHCFQHFDNIMWLFVYISRSARESELI